MKGRLSKKITLEMTLGLQGGMKEDEMMTSAGSAEDRSMSDDELALLVCKLEALRDFQAFAMTLSAALRLAEAIAKMELRVWQVCYQRYGGVVPGIISGSNSGGYDNSCDYNGYDCGGLKSSGKDNCCGCCSCCDDSGGHDHGCDYSGGYSSGGNDNCWDDIDRYDLRPLQQQRMCKAGF